MNISIVSSVTMSRNCSQPVVAVVDDPSNSIFESINLSFSPPNSRSRELSASLYLVTIGVSMATQGAGGSYHS